MNREYRVASEAWPLEDMEIRADSDGLNFRGYAAVFGKRSEDLGGFRETIRPGAFTKTLTERRTIKMFLNHNPDIVLGSTRKATLALTEDDRGLLAEATLPDNEWGRPVADAVRRGDIDSMSFGFLPVKDTWDEPKTNRELIEVKLFEVSPVTAWPAYPQTSASVRHLAAEIGEDEQPLMDAVTALFKQDTRLTPEQRDLLVRAINTRTDERLITARLADLMARHEARRPVAPNP